MITYNVTTKIDSDIEDEWIAWQKKESIPAIMALGFFYDYRFSKLLVEDETDGKTYVIQFYAKDKVDFENYEAQHSRMIRHSTVNKWGNKFVVFESLLSAVQ